MSGFGSIIQDIQNREGFYNRKDMADALSIHPSALSFYVSGGRRTPDYVVIELSGMECVKSEEITLTELLIIRNFYAVCSIEVNNIQRMMTEQFLSGQIDVLSLIPVIVKGICRSKQAPIGKRTTYKENAVNNAALLIAANEVIGTIFLKAGGNYVS